LNIFLSLFPTLIFKKLEKALYSNMFQYLDGIATIARIVLDTAYALNHNIDQ